MLLEVGLLLKMSYSGIIQNTGTLLYLYILYLYLYHKNTVLCCYVFSLQYMITVMYLNLNVKCGHLGHTLTLSVLYMLTG